MIVRFTELNDCQIEAITRGTLVLDYQMHPYVVVADTDLGWYLEDMTSIIPLNLVSDITPFFSPEEIESLIYVEKDDYCNFKDWNVIL